MTDDRLYRRYPTKKHAYGAGYKAGQAAGADPNLPEAPAPGPGKTGADLETGSEPLTREAIKKMTPTEINARWAEVSAVLEKK